MFGNYYFMYGGHSEVVITAVCGTAMVGSIPAGRPKINNYLRP
jgi:hypothetical protein